MNLRVRGLVAALALVAATPAAASVTYYTNEASFQSAFTGGFTVVNLDAAPLSAFASGYLLDDAAPAAALAGLGLDSVGLNAQVVGGQNYQTPAADRDRLILNGAHFGGLVVFNFLNPTNGVGVWTNFEDGGHVRAFTGANLTGDLVGEAPLGGGAFGGLISSQAIGSVQFTCEFNFDSACGLYDLQFGANLPENPTVVPEPATWALLISGFAMSGAALRRRRASLSVA